MSQYIFCHNAKCVIKATKKDDSYSSSIQSEDIFMSTLAQSFEMKDFLSDDQELKKIKFDLPQ